MRKARVLVSACLLGVNCRYNGTGGSIDELEELKECACLIPACPEILGGLPTPRPPAECRGENVVNNEGQDVTAQFRRGAEEALKIGQYFCCKKAVLKSRSPSCGMGMIYDGTFTGTLVPGDGVTAKLLRLSGFSLYSEENILEAQDTFRSKTLDSGKCRCYTEI